MYTTTVQIPAVGETNSLPSLQGEALQVDRLDFLDAEDPLGNPLLVERNRHFSVEMNLSNPIKQPFDGLEVRNEGNALAAGTSAILRIYDDAANLTASRPRRTQSIRAAAEYEDYNLQTSFELEENGVKKREVIPANRDRAWRVLGMVCRVHDDAGKQTDGFPLYLNIEPQSALRGVSRRQHIYAIPGRDLNCQLVTSPLLVPPDRKMEVQAVSWTGGSGSDTAGIDFDGLAIVDKNSPTPPK